MKKSREELLKSLDGWMLKAKRGGTKKKKDKGDLMHHAVHAQFHREASDLHRQLAYQNGDNAQYHRSLAMAHKAKELKHEVNAKASCPRHHWQHKQIKEDEINEKVARMLKQYTNQDLNNIKLESSVSEGGIRA